jgi:hypothetical protein
LGGFNKQSRTAALALPGENQPNGLMVFAVAFVPVSALLRVSVQVPGLL